MESFRSLTRSDQLDCGCAKASQSTAALSTLCVAVDEAKNSLFDCIQKNFEGTLASSSDLIAAFVNIENRFILLRKVMDLRHNGINCEDRNVDVRQYFYELEKKYSYLALANPGVSWSCFSNDGPNMQIRIDEDILTILLSGIVEIAVRNTKSGFLKLSCAASNGSLEVCIHDSGTGLNANLIRHNCQVVDSELTLDDLPLDTINLTHVRFFSRLAGAQYSIDNADGIGTKVTISIPFRLPYKDRMPCPSDK